MDSHRWDKVQELFDHAVDLPTEEREAFLRERCAGDESLLNEVLSLIAADNLQHSFLDKQAMDLFEIKSVEYSEGQLVGPYRLISKIAAGGMGLVFLAERADGQYTQQVALKLIKRGMDSDEILRRFSAERQILANLNHPHIARLIDGGLTTEGVPWFTMEYVDGEPIDAYCDRHRLTINERLALFQTVCRTVQYAQQNLVVHRDLKPSNIMVTDDGSVKLLDFGIAKMLSTEQAPGDGLELTRTGLRVMTPGYASPEQVRGDKVTTSSDVYSLGVVLYRLLTGSAPYHLTGDTPLELERVICQTDPKRPSAALTGQQSQTGAVPKEDADRDAVCRSRRTPLPRLRRQLSGDLDNICLMALRKEPERRYQTAGQLADDVERYLNGHPVAARGDSFGYRAGKFIRRNRVSVLASTAVVLVIAALVVVYTMKLQQERDRAQQEARKAEEVSQFLVGLFEVSEPSESLGETITARELLDKGAQRLLVDLTDQPETQAAMMTVVGNVYHQLGLSQKADSILTRAMNIWQDHTGLDNADAAKTVHQLAVVAYDLAEYDRAELLYLRALEINRNLYGEEHATVAEDINNLGAVFKRKGDLNAAREMFEKALDLRLRLTGEMDLAVAHSMNHLGGILREQGEYERAEKLLRRGLEIRRELVGPYHFETIASMGNMARFHTQFEEYDKAEALYREALELLHTMVGEEHRYVAGITGSLAHVLLSKGDLAGAEQYYRESLDIFTAILPPRHVHTSSAMVGVADALRMQGRSGEAEPLLREALSIRETAWPPDHWQVAQARAMLGLCLADIKRETEAIPLLEESLSPLRTRMGAEHRLPQEAGARLVRILEEAGQTQRADSLRDAMAVSATVDGGATEY